MKFSLLVTKGKKQGMSIPITIDLFLIGSDEVCQLHTKGKSVARQHCALLTRGRKAFVRDLDSGLPTLLNDTLVPPGEERPLHAGDRLQVGSFEFRVELREKPLSEKGPDEWALTSLGQNAMHGSDHSAVPLPPPGDLPRASTPAKAAAAILDRMQASREQVKGRLRIKLEGSTTVVRLHDHYLVEDSEIARVRSELQETLRHRNLRVLLDFNNVKRMSTAAVKMIDELYSWLRQLGSTLALCRVRPEVRDILPELSLNNAIPHFPDQETALEARW
jgi:anti-anti-sigma regulatory factor/pSer/pThr/pTyr-binding forkhead associated (FHA) protein